MLTTRHLTAVAALAALGLGLATPAASAKDTTTSAKSRQRSTLQQSVDAIEKTGTVAVVAQSTGPDGRRYATTGVSDTATGRAARVTSGSGSRAAPRPSCRR